MSLTDSNRRKPYNDFEFYLAAEVYAVAFSYLENSSQHFNNLESHIAKSIFLILNWQALQKSKFKLSLMQKSTFWKCATLKVKKYITLDIICCFYTGKKKPYKCDSSLTANTKGRGLKIFGTLTSEKIWIILLKILKAIFLKEYSLSFELTSNTKKHV